MREVSSADIGEERDAQGMDPRSLQSVPLKYPPVYLTADTCEETT